MKKLSLLACAGLMFCTHSIFVKEISASVEECHQCHQDKKCGTVPFPSNSNEKTPKPILHSSKVWNFVSEPHLHPMKVKVNVNKKGVGDGLIFVAPYTFSSDRIYGQTGSLILNNEGIPVWFRALKSPNLMNTDFRVQTLLGKPVLTFWQGTLATPPVYTNLPAGSPEPGCCFYILDNTYREIMTVSAKGDEKISDIHEFLITPEGTALFFATQAIPLDLRPYGGPKNGFIQNFAIQEIDLKTNQLVFYWSALDHIPLTESHISASSAKTSNNVWDVYHLNSIGLTDDKDEIIVSSRSTWTIYRINKQSGDIVWRLGGKSSDFKIDHDAQFSWQHDGRWLSSDTLSLFDDNCCKTAITPPNTPAARGIVLHLDYKTMHASLKRSYFHDPALQVGSQGNMQSLENGNKFIGWGEDSYYSEYKNQGNTEEDSSLNTVYSAEMPGNNISYRAYRNVWVGKPYYPPSVVAKSVNEKSIVYVSWNGSTETASWKVFAGNSPENLKKIKTVDKSGFETTISADHSGPYFQVKALNSQGKVIGKSEVVRIEK